MLFAHSDRPCVNSTPIFSRQQCWIQHILPSWEKRRSRKLLFTCYILTSSDCCSTIHSLHCTSVFIHFCSLRLLSFSILESLHDFNTSFHLLWTIYLKLINILKALSFCGNFDLYLLPVYSTKPNHYHEQNCVMSTSYCPMPKKAFFSDQFSIPW